MKKLYILSVLLIFLFTSCEKVVEIDVPSIEPKLIIDASFEIFFDKSPVTAKVNVKLTSSADYFDEIIPVVTNAIVFLTDLSNNTIIVFSDSNADGSFEPITPFIPADNKAYELTIIYKNETYKGVATKVKSTPFIDVFQGDQTLFSGKETELKVSFFDAPIVENYYLFDFSKDLFLTIDDRFFNGAEYNFSFFYQEDELVLPETVTLKMSGISKDYFSYFRVLVNQSGQNSGGPFESVPSSLLGNMINTTNEDNFPLGYFHISETDTFTVDLVQKN
ncbi:hypothetical protein BST83_04050 [Polaribacter filamentus]|uniref:DUF4249 domain-containing protein n=1 Tax=Polaribacter filamentus TaxID=53483 RepID=A0A2S7KUX4_9FLAO|nr:DUF4249 family protein [Polaribacter filamentus]PQB06439.1 hypothetical protein BST83_04050 [Polaribacter filamentus]